MVPGSFDPEPLRWLGVAGPRSRVLRLLTAVLAVVGTSIGFAIAAGAAWGAWSATGAGHGTARASRLPAGRRPAATVSGTQVSVSWSAVFLPSGADVGGYVVNRLGGSSPIQVCRVATPTTSCTDTTPPTNQQISYTVTPAQESWRGATSPPSAPVVVAA